MITSPAPPDASPSFISPMDFTTQSDIDLEICRLLERTRELWSAHNAQAPVSRLPPEVLVQIFAWLQDMYDYDRFTCFYKSGWYFKNLVDVNWIRVTQVYRYWRSVARGFPGLWNRNVSSSPIWSGESYICPRLLPLVEPQCRILSSVSVDSSSSATWTTRLASQNTPFILALQVHHTLQSDIELEISRLLDRIRRHWSERNALAPVSQLPPEVLIQIFGWLQDVYNHTFSRFRQPGPLGSRYLYEIKWTRVTRVSRHWRQVARDTPSLWNRVILRSSFWLDESLACSYPLPLIIEAKRLDPYRDLAQLRRALITSFHRTQIFDISFEFVSHDTISSLGLSRPAPNLEIFKLSGTRSYGFLRQDLPDDLFKGISPRLRHVALSKLSCSWKESTFLQNLTTLAIESPIPHLSINILTSILHRMPTLISLRLKDVLEDEEDIEDELDAEPSPATKPVHLRSLESFYFEGNTYSQDNAFINRLRFPGQTRVKFESHLDVMGSSFPQILDTFVQARMGEAVSIRSMDFLCESRAIFKLAWTDITSISASGHPSIPSFSRSPFRSFKNDLGLSSSISVGAYHSQKPFATDWMLQLHVLPLSTLEVFRTNIEVTPVTLWTNVFRSLTKLREVFLQGSSGAFLLQYLVDNHLELATKPSDLIALPSLRKIHLKETNPENIQPHSVVQALATRKSRGSPIDVISVDESYRSIQQKQWEELVTMLKTVAEDVQMVDHSLRVVHPDEYHDYDSDSDSDSDW